MAAVRVRGVRWSVCVVVAGAVLMLSACGGSTSTAARSGSTGSSSTGAARKAQAGASTTTTSTPSGQSSAAGGSAGVASTPSPAQVQEADAINLQAGDLPAGWTSTGAPTSSSTAQATSAVTGCPGVAKRELTTFVSSSTFDEEVSGTTPTAVAGGVEVGSLVGFASTPSVARQVVDFLGSPTGATCVRTAVDRALSAFGSGSPVHVGDVSVTSTTQQLDGVPMAVLSIGFSVQLASAGVDQSVDETVDMFSEQETLVEMWTVNLPASDRQLADQLLAGLVRRA